MTKLLVSTTFVLLVTAAAPALDYSLLVRQALEADPVVKTLEIDLRRAEVDLGLARLARAPAWGLGVEGSAEVGSTSPTWSANPQTTLEWPQGPRWSLGLPVKFADQRAVTPTLGLTLPLVSGPAPLDELALRVAADRARRALRDRRLEVERRLVEGLSGLYRSWAALSEARRKHLGAQADLDRAVALDGAVPGGRAYLDGERAVRLAGRELQRAQSAYQKSRNEVTLLGISGLSDAAPHLVFPPADLGTPLPDPQQVVGVVQANDDVDLAVARAREARKTTKASVSWAGGYDLEGAALDLSSGLQWSNEDWATSLGLGWGPTTGTRLDVSMTWKPRSGARVALDAEARMLEDLSHDADRAQAHDDALRALAALEQRRDELLSSAEHLEEDLRWARDQASRYGEWRRAGLVTATEAQEVEAVLVSVEAEVVLQTLDTLGWNLDRLRLTEERMDHEEPN